MQKELGRYLLPVSRKKYKTVRHLKKYPPKDFNQWLPIRLDYNLNLHLEKTETSTGYHVPSITTKESYPG